MIAVHDTALGGPSPDCAAFGGGGFAFYAELSAEPATCVCSCGESTSFACGRATFELFTNDSCSGAAVAAMQLYPNGYGSCSGHALLAADYASVRLSSIEPMDEDDDVCKPGTEAHVPEPVWGEKLTVCPLSGPALCLGGEQLCIEKPPSAFNQGICIFKDGDVSCPAGNYQHRLLRHRTLDDSRACALCKCAPPEPCAPAATLTRSDPTCTNGAHFSTVGECEPFAVPAADPSLSYGYYAEPSSCTPSAPQSIGGVAPADPVTVCCAPGDGN